MKTEKESNILPSSLNQFSEVCEHGLKHGGVHLVSVKGHGKTRLLFGMARELRQKSRVIIFDGSETWLYGFDKIPTFTVKERDIVLSNDVEKIDEIERYKIKKWNLVKFALHTHKDILFRLKTRKPSKRGFFIRTVTNYLDRLQRESREETQDNEAKGYISYFIEEAQDCFNSRSTTRLEAEEFLTVFNEARNQKEAFYTASQRLTDFSKTIRTKQTYAIGKIPEEDKTVAIRRLQKKYEIDFSKLEARKWSFEGKVFESPNWKQEGKPYQINKEIKKEFVKQLKPLKPQKKGLLSRLLGKSLLEKVREHNEKVKESKGYTEESEDIEEQEELEDEETELEWLTEEEQWS